MARKDQCPQYANCGFVLWREQRLMANARPLPEDGDCGKPPYGCGRLEPDIPNLKIETFGPITRDEFDIAFPKTDTQS